MLRCIMLQRVAVCYSVLQCVAVCYNVLQCAESERGVVGLSFLK